MVYTRDVLEVPSVGSATAERLGYDTQKPEALIEKIIESSSNPGDLIADFFCGSGTTCAIAEKKGRRWIGCDLSRWSIHVTRKRLLEIKNCKPFEVLNLGKYERQYWQDIRFEKDSTETIIFKYIAFILKLYGANVLSGASHIHGKRGDALVHVGAVDSPITIDEVNSCINECIALRQKALNILGWEWEMGLNELVVKEARTKGVTLRLLNIPREVMDSAAVEKGDIKFYELAYADFQINSLGDKAVTVELKDFAVSNSEHIPEEIHKNITKWSDYIDYWSIDWNFENDTFMNSWVSYRTRLNRKLELKSGIHRYERPGKYRILVKIIDIFGNDTSILREIMVN